MLNFAPSRRGSVFVLASIPAVIFAFCPQLDSPFESAKLSVLLIFGAAALLLCAFISRPSSSLNFKPLKLCLLCWLAAIALATLRSRDFASAWRPLLAFASAGCIVLALWRLRVSAQLVVRWIGISSALLAALVIAGALGFDLPRLLSGAAAPGRMRAAATLGNPLFVASFLCAAMWSVAALRGCSAMMRRAMFLVTVLAVAATGERTALAAVAAGALCWLAASRGSYRGLRHAVGAVSIIAVVSLAVWMFNPRTAEDALDGRVFLWRTSLHHVGLIGSGAGGFYRSYDANLSDLADSMPAEKLRFVSYETQAHNVFVQQTVESGVLGTAALTLLLLLWFVRVWPLRVMPEARAALAGMAAYVAAGCFDNPLSRPEGVLLPALLMTLPLLCVAENGEEGAVHTELSPLRWLMPAAALGLLIAAAANAMCSYAIFAGERAEQLAQMPEAERWMRRAVAIDAGSQDARFDLVRVLCESGDYRGCWSESEVAMRWVDEAELHLLRVRALEAMGRDSLARRELDAARRQFPWSDELLREELDGPGTE